MQNAKLVSPSTAVGWWNCGLPSPCPHELFAFAAAHQPADLALATPDQLSRVAEAYIRHCRKVGHWAFFSVEVPYHTAGEQGYRDQLAGYKAAQAYCARHPETIHHFEYFVRFSKARQARGMKGWGLFRRVGDDLNKCISDHATEAEACAALVKAATVTTTTAASKAA